MRFFAAKKNETGTAENEASPTLLASATVASRSAGVQPVCGRVRILPGGGGQGPARPAGVRGLLAGAVWRAWLGSAGPLQAVACTTACAGVPNEKGLPMFQVKGILGSSRIVIPLIRLPFHSFEPQSNHTTGGL